MAANSLKKSAEVLRPFGVFRAAFGEALGFSRSTLARMATRGELTRLGQGVYVHPDAALDPAVFNYALATCRFGDEAVIGGRTALYHYALLDEGPSDVWVMVPYSVKVRVSAPFRLLRTRHDPAVGVTDCGTYRMVTIERAIVEAFAYQTKIGASAALSAGRTALRERKTSINALSNAAQALGRSKMMLRHWEALTIR